MIGRMAIAFLVAYSLVSAGVFFVIGLYNRDVRRKNQWLAISMCDRLRISALWLYYMIIYSHF